MKIHKEGMTMESSCMVKPMSNRVLNKCVEQDVSSMSGL